VVCLLLLCAVSPAFAASRVMVIAPPPGAVLSPGTVPVRVAFATNIDARFVDLEWLQSDALTTLAAVRDPADPQMIDARIPAGQRRPGVSWLRWRVLLSDGHVEAGNSCLGGPACTDPITKPTRLEQPLGAILTALARLAVLVGVTLVLGFVVVRWLIASRAWSSGGVHPLGRVDDSEAFRARTHVALQPSAFVLKWLLAGAIAAWCGGALLWAIGTTWWLQHGVGAVPELLFHTRVGGEILVVGVAGLCVGLSCVAGRNGLWDGRMAVRDALMGLGAVIGVCAMSWGGHAADGTDVVINECADALHGIASALWLGGLVGLVVCVIGPARRMIPEDRLRFLSAAVVKFSSLAIGCVGVLIATGTYRALAEVAQLSDLVSTGYGRALLVKLGLFGALLGFGAYNRLIIHPRLEGAALAGETDLVDADSALMRTLRWEIGFAFVLLCAVAVLLALTPAVA